MDFRYVYSGLSQKSWVIFYFCFKKLIFLIRSVETQPIIILWKPEDVPVCRHEMGVFAGRAGEIANASFLTCSLLVR